MPRRGSPSAPPGAAPVPAAPPRQSQPFSFTMCDISMMNFPSLYFWLLSNACSWGGTQCQPRTGIGVPGHTQGTSWAWSARGCPWKGLGCPDKGWGPQAVPAAGERGTHVFPAQGGLAALAEDVGHRVQPRQQQPLLSRAAPHVHPAPRAGCPTGWAHPAWGHSGTGGAPPPCCHPRYSHGVEQVGTAVAALEGLWGHGECHRWVPPVPQHPSPCVLLPSRCTATVQNISLGTPRGDTCQLGDTEGETVTSMGASHGSPATPRTPRHGGGGCFLPHLGTPQGEHSPPWGHHRGTVGRNSALWGHGGGTPPVPAPDPWDSHCPSTQGVRTQPGGHCGGTLEMSSSWRARCARQCTQL